MKKKVIIKQFLNSKLNFIPKIIKVDHFNDYPKFHQYTIYSNENKINNLNINALSLKSDEAYVKNFFEAIERLSLINLNNKKFIFGAYNKLKLKYKVVNPNLFFHFSDNKNFQNAPLRWVWSKNLMTDDKILIPAQLVYFLEHKKEPLIRFSDTQGAAAYSTLEEALLKGLLELIERESFASFFYYENKAFLIDIQSIEKEGIKYLIT